MFDIGTAEMVILAIVALIVVGPKDLPKLMRSVSSFVGKIRSLAGDFRSGMQELADEVERETDPFREERDAEGITPDMSPDEITDHIMGNKDEADLIADDFMDDDNHDYGDSADDHDEDSDQEKSNV